jgi:uncharacterized membrane protein
VVRVVSDIEQKVDGASSGYIISMENVLQAGFNLFRKTPGIFIIFTIIAGIFLSNPLTGLLLGGPVAIGYYTIAHRVRHDRPVEVSDLFPGFSRFVPLFLVTLLVSLVTLLGLLLLVIPGIYFSVSYLFAHLFVWFYDVPPSEAIRLSRKVVSGNFTQIFLLWLILGGINLLGSLALGIGLLLTVPFSFCVIYAAFDDIIGIPE